MRERCKAIGRLVSAACIIAGCQRPPEPKPTPLPTQRATETPVTTPTATLEQERIINEFLASYRIWKISYLVPEGNELKVIQPENGGVTTSEGIAYGMILSVNTNEKKVFDKLWSFAKNHFNSNGLMSWKVEPNGQIPDPNSATDGDLDMAYSLIIADRQWGGYQDEAKTLLTNIMDHCVEQGTFVLKPGDGWGGSEVTNPSYFAPAYYQMFKDFTGDQRWDLVAQKSREILDKINVNHVLFPDWTMAEGTPAQGQTYDYSYNAVRVPWRQAQAHLWFGDQHAFSQMQKVNTFFANIPIGAVVDGYSANGKVLGNNHNAAFVAPLAAISETFSDQDLAVGELIRLGQENYYNDSLRLLAFLLLSEQMLH
ncbi:MAG: glycosyl hydrolase family 8 [Patescibacteria group bacterium]|jgi:endo-1,4-beta-D-glucanase Y